MMERIWLPQYDQKVPHNIDLTVYSSLRDILKKSCQKYPKHRAYSNLGHALTYTDLLQLSSDFGAYLTEVSGLGKGDRVAIMMPNILQYPVALFGALRCGLVVVNVNPMYTARELKHQLVDSGARAVVVLQNFAATLEEVVGETGIETIVTTQLGDLLPQPKRALVNFVVKRIKKLVPAYSLPTEISFNGVLAVGRGLYPAEPDLGHEDLAFLQYTGGTTGVSKGAMLTHGNMVANLLQASAWITPVVKPGEEILITALPLYHIFSLTANCLTYMMLGGENVLITNPRDSAAFVKCLKSLKFSSITGVNTLFNSLLNTPGFDQCDFGCLRVTLGGGMAVQRAVAEKWMEVTGHPLIEAYGLTETSPAACINPITNTEYNGAIGLPVSSTFVTIRDDEGQILPEGEVGEICIRGPQVMKGYWNQPEETAKVMLDGDCLRTGDVGRMDSKGYVYIEDRKKDIILVSGFNVYPNEIEGVAVSHPGVLEAVAVGVNHPKSGEVVKLFVVRSEPELVEKDIISYCREHLAAYKIPKEVEFRESLPKSNVGKILRRELRDGD